MWNEKRGQEVEKKKLWLEEEGEGERSTKMYRFFERSKLISVMGAFSELILFQLIFPTQRVWGLTSSAVLHFYKSSLFMGLLSSLSVRFLWLIHGLKFKIYVLNIKSCFLLLRGSRHLLIRLLWFHSRKLLVHKHGSPSSNTERVHNSTGGLFRQDLKPWALRMIMGWVRGGGAKKMTQWVRDLPWKQKELSFSS